MLAHPVFLRRMVDTYHAPERKRHQGGHTADALNGVRNSAVLRKGKG